LTPRAALPRLRRASPRKKREEMLLKITTMILLLSGCLLGAGCRTSSRFTERLAILAVPPLARSAGGSQATTDSYLRSLEVAEPSRQVLDAIAALPKNDAILFIAPTQEPETELAYRTIASLSWPHEVGALHCGLGSLSGANGGQPALLFQPRAAKPIRWLLFYRLAPPKQSTVKAEIGPHLKLTPIEEGKEWTSYCSR